jgi:TetR/AcrR family transcriptional repressor of nem operon
MRPGPTKSFDPDEALEQARDLFWSRGYDGTGLSQLEAHLGIGRKSLYDTFGSKRELFLKALERYTDTVIARIVGRLEHAEGTAALNLERALERLAQYHGSGGSDGCLLGVAMAQAKPEDGELAAILRGYLQRLERAFTSALGRGIVDGEIGAHVRPRDAARNLVALTQGMALLGRVGSTAATQRSIVRAALDALRP